MSAAKPVRRASTKSRWVARRAMSDAEMAFKRLRSSTARGRQLESAGRAGAGLKIAPQLSACLAGRPAPAPLVDPGGRPAGDQTQEDGDEHHDPQWDADRQDGVAGRN